MNSETFKAIETIIKNGEEFEAIKILQKEMNRQLESAEKDLADCKAKLRAIKKINQGKNVGIDNILEDD